MIIVKKKQGVPFKCKVGIHGFSKWGKKFTPDRSRYTTEYQQRVCSRCNYVDERKI